MKKTIRFLAVLILCISFVLVFASCTNDDSSPYNQVVKYDKGAMAEFIKNYNDSNMVCDGKILIVLTDEATAHIDEYTVDDFSQIAPISVKKIGKQILTVTIAEKDKESILRAVYIVSLRSDVMSAEPNTYSEPF